MIQAAESTRDAAEQPLLLRMLADPQAMATLPLRDWDALLREARVTRMLSRLAVMTDDTGVTDALPQQVRRHLVAARVMADRNDVLVRWEVRQIAKALRQVDTPIVLLKGAAYLHANLATSRGRIYGDTDILVKHDELDAVERALREHGWEVNEDNPYDEAYFRKWLHELPPMRHNERKTSIDVHHTIIPRTDTLRVDPQMLLDEAVPVPSEALEQFGERVQTLSPRDMALHSATHLFRNGDFTTGLRDLADLDSLLRQFGGSNKPSDHLDAASDDDRIVRFWSPLCERAIELDLTLPLFCGVRFTRHFFDTPVPASILERIDDFAPGELKLSIVDKLVRRAVLPRSIHRVDRKQAWAIAALAYWPMPRLKAMMSGLFWVKRLPSWRREPRTSPRG